MAVYTTEDLKKMQAWPLERKIQVTQTRIMEWYMRWNGQVYVSFSGGKDSTVLLDLARRMYPDIEAVFIDTGLEYPEIKEFVKTKENVTWLRPKMSFKQVIEKYGYPVISKENAQKIYEIRNTKSEKLKNRGLYGGKNGNGKLPDKWKFMLDAPFKISHHCCNILKKNPVRRYEKETGKKCIVATMACESRLRKTQWLNKGCNSFEGRRPLSAPLSFWTEQDILMYLKRFNIPYCSIYGDIVEDSSGRLITTGENRTGCMFCMFGIHLEKEPNKFQRMAITHPKLYDYCINKLGCGKVLDYIGVNYKPID